MEETRYMQSENEFLIMSHRNTPSVTLQVLALCAFSGVLGASSVIVPGSPEALQIAHILAEEKERPFGFESSLIQLEGKQVRDHT